MYQKLRIALIGQAAFGEAVLKALMDKGANVMAVWCPPDKEGRPADAVKLCAEECGIPVHQFRRIRDQEAIDAFRAINADLGVMAIGYALVSGP